MAAGCSDAVVVTHRSVCLRSKNDPNFLSLVVLPHGGEKDESKASGDKPNEAALNVEQSDFALLNTNNDHHMTSTRDACI